MSGRVPVFFAFDGFDIFGVGKADIYVMFEVIKNRNPILSSDFIQT